MNQIIPKDRDNCILNNLRADVIRKSIENKNLLANKGSMYVGTGNVETITIGDDLYVIPITAELSTQDQGQILADTVLTVQSAVRYGIHYQKITSHCVEPTTQANPLVYDITAREAVLAKKMSARGNSVPKAGLVKYVNSSKTTSLETALSQLEKKDYEGTFGASLYYQDRKICTVTGSSLYKETEFCCLTLNFSFEPITNAQSENYYKTNAATISASLGLPSECYPYMTYYGYYIERVGLSYTDFYPTPPITVPFTIPLEIDITNTGEIKIINRGNLSNERLVGGSYSCSIVVYYKTKRVL